MNLTNGVDTTVSIEDGPSIGQQSVQIVTLSNDVLTVRFLSFGATMWQLYPTGDAPENSLCLHLADPASYEDNPAYFGAFVGPYANRIGNARFDLDGETYHLEPNEGPNHLHGGPNGFSKRHWETTLDIEGGGVRFSLQRPDGQDGYPGTLNVEAEWILDGATLTNRWRASTDKTTPVSLTNHAYWNLDGSGNIVDHTVQIPASTAIDLDDALIPTGGYVDLAGTGLDLQAATPVSDLVSVENQTGIDRTYVLEEGPTILSNADGTRSVSIETSLPGMQFYTGQYLDASTGTAGYGPFSGLCLETQQFPDAVNQAAFPSPLVDPANPVTHWTTWTFSL